MSPIDISKFEQLKTSGDLPSPKGVALAIVRLTQQDDVSMAELARVIKTDPALVGRLIKAANGAATARRRPVASVQDALIVLGLPTVRSLALGFSLLSGYSSGACRNFDYREFWGASLACAIAMQALTARTRVAMPEEAFCAGLLVRIGELALATLFPEDYSRVLAKHIERRNVPLADLEHEAFTTNHRELTAAMLVDWGVPKVFVDPIYYHEELETCDFPEGSRYALLVQSLAVARQFATICTAPEKQRSALMPRLFLLGSHLALDAESLTTLCDRVVQEWQEWGALLNVRTQKLPSFEELGKMPPGAAPLAASIVSPAFGGQRMRILVVDDDATMRVMLRSVLEKAGHEVIDAKNGREGMEIALESEPQMMIIDWMMPEMDGIAMTRALRQTKVGRSIYILILTSLEDEEKLVEAFENGVDDFMSKPLKPRVLMARLSAGCRVIKLQQEVEHDREEIRHFAADLAIANRRLQEVALTDALTGCPNRRYAMERIQQEWASSSRNLRPLACMVVDVDEFKQINDCYGHDIGDTMLQQVVTALKGSVRSHDIVCRTGGDEFLVICPETTLEQANACGERLRRSVEALQVKSGMLALRVSVSVGIAVRDKSMAEADSLIKCADQGLYLAKERGRNRIASAQVTP